jgi:hypothetical protein
VRHWIKTIIAIVLLPVCFGAGEAVVQMLRLAGAAETFWVAAVAGAACWLAIYLLLPKPMWVYVVGHELTHALWAWLFGGKVKRFKATAKGGHVVVTKSNFLIALAPYFFPIYALVIILLFSTGNWLWDWRSFRVWFHLLVGAAYAFHVTLTWHVLKSRQSDIVEQGYLFSAVVIWLGNIGVLVFGIPVLTGKVGVNTALYWCWTETEAIFHQFTRLL